MKLFVAALLSSLSLSAFAQICYVDMIQKHTGRVVRSFSAYGDASSCVDGMKECRKSIRLDYSSNSSYPNGSLDCVRQDSYAVTPIPQPRPGQPRPGQPRPQHPRPQQPQPQQPQYNEPSTCSWFDGASHGIAQRGWHAFRVIRGLHYSLAFHGNNGGESQMRCLKDVIFNHDEYAYRQEVSFGAAQTCTCAWYDGVTVSPRGWHMAYKVQMFDRSEITLSSSFHSNNGTASQQACNTQLIHRNFVCPIVR